MTWSYLFEPQGAAHGSSIYVDSEDPLISREDLLRYRWEDQLKVINPDLWNLVEAELTPTFQEVKDLRALVADLRQEVWEATQQASARQTTINQLRKDVTRHLTNQDTLRGALSQRTEEATNTAADALTLAQALQRLALMMTALDDFPPESPLSDEETTILRSYIPPEEPVKTPPWSIDLECPACGEEFASAHLKAEDIIPTPSPTDKTPTPVTSLACPSCGHVMSASTWADYAIKGDPPEEEDSPHP